MTMFNDPRARFSGSIEGSPEQRIARMKERIEDLERAVIGSGAGLGGIAWQGQETDGVDQNRDTTSSYSTQIMVLRLVDPIRLSGLLWDVRNTGDYELHLLWSANIANTWRKIWDGTVGAAGEITMNLTNPEVLLPGTYYLGLTRPAGAVTWSDYNAASYSPADPAWMLDGIYYNTTAFASYVPGAKLVYQKGVWL